ncbi:AmmeMemoRadiSam system radical SAM enzyme [Raineyella sp.]|uniref:AmmeMemoRadiSam system radical SAM enzyme n=1 Tax=Raineyella sp. TaxID=1911550 RepID=UPI002B2120D1|nr:AmmeMemoRadiSam system radical SAM enzyme [Raineyella sp.]MEA5153351.1 AmmeMemoRadiSam system radical SAM enzyme [Raineyella sp.]
MTPHVPGQPARWWHADDAGHLVCDLCPRGCILADGQAGFCAVRVRDHDRLVLTTYGRGTGFCVEAIERRPLHHFLPGTPAMCLGSAGCSLACRTCRVWRPETVAEVSGRLEDASPLTVAGLAADWRCGSIAFTYNDPAIYAEYAIAAARAAHVLGLRAVAVTAGYLAPAARKDFFGVMDAALIELKVFDEEAHRRYTGGSLRTVLDTLVHVARRHGTWLEISTRLVPGLNDAPGQLARMCSWIAAELGPDVPLHFSTPPAQTRPAPPLSRAGSAAVAASGGASVGAGRMSEAPAGKQSTSASSSASTGSGGSGGRADPGLAREIALSAGLHYVYTGLGEAAEGRTTRCPSCGAVLIERDVSIRRYRLTSEGRCPECRTAVPGLFGDRAGEAVPHRIPVRLP